MAKFTAPCGLKLDETTMIIGNKGELGCAPNQVINLQSQEVGIPFEVDEQIISLMLSKNPPIIQVILDNTNVTLYRFAFKGDEIYYSNMLYYNNKRYYVGMKITSNIGIINATNDNIT